MSFDWPVASPESAGLDSRLLKEGEAFVRDVAPYIQAFAVVRRGELVWESYFGGTEADLTLRPSDGSMAGLGEPYRTSERADQPHCVKSVTKSVMSALYGIALREGVIPSVDATLGDLLPARFWTADVDARKRDITIRSLLQMRSGLEWLENGPITLRWLQSGDLIGFTLRKQAVEVAPGERWLYSTADTHLLGVALAERSGMSNLEFADRHLLGPLGVAGHRWTVDPQGYNCGGSELFLTPRDMAAFGELYRRDGDWHGTQLVPAEWVEESIAWQPEPTAATFEEAARAAPPYPIPDGARFWREGYGYLWWRTTLGGHPVHHAVGYGGQYVMVVDDLEMVIVQNATVRMTEADMTYERQVGGYRLAEEFIVRAAG